MESQEMIVSKFNGVADVRGMQKDGQAWFVAKDVCEALELKNYSTSLDLLDPDEKDNLHTVDAIGRRHCMTMVSEFGAYSLILRSRKPEAKAFKRWLTHEVIPCIMRTGAYMTDQAAKEFMANPIDKMQSILDHAKELRELNRRQSEVIDMQSKAIDVTSKALDQARLELADAEPYIAFARSFMDTDALILATYIAAECHENTAVFNQGKPVRIVMVDGKPWWVAAGICKVMGLGSTPMALRKIPTKHKGVHRIDTSLGTRTVSMISDSCRAWRPPRSSRRPSGA